ncbi:MAG: hypothetical protein IPP71_09550 [Bacteroidetes bacterium]|nr:hypothetical protein [Bacteroidota bacterium]
MSLTPQQNLMMGKIEKMRSLLMKEMGRGKQFIVWSLKYDELEMIDSFCLVENSDHAKMEDIIIDFKTSFNDYAEYSNDLIGELRVMQEQTKGFAGDSDWVLKNWDIDKVISNVSNKSAPATFLKVVSSIAEAVPDFGGKIIAYLEPSQCEDPKALLKWLREMLTEVMPSRVTVMMAEQDSSSTLSSLCVSFPEISAIIVPDLKMDQAIKQMATAGNPANPDVQFRKCIFSMSEAVGKKK